MLLADDLQKIALLQHATFAGLAELDLRLPFFIHEIECDAFVQVGDVQNPQMSFAQHNEAKRKDLECDRQEPARIGCRFSMSLDESGLRLICQGSASM